MSIKPDTASITDAAVNARPEADRPLVPDEAPRIGGILAALRRSPLVGIHLDLARLHEEARAVDL